MIADSPIEESARRLISFGRASEPNIQAAYLFPDHAEIRVLYVDDTVPQVRSGEAVAPFYFGPSEETPYPSAIALIHPADFRSAALPSGWGDWQSAIAL